MCQFRYSLHQIYCLGCDSWEDTINLYDGLAQAGKKPLSKPMIDQFSTTYMRYQEGVIYIPTVQIEKDESLCKPIYVAPRIGIM